MKTNIDDIYAAGDIVEFPLFTAEDQQVNVQHWQMANAHGKNLEWENVILPPFNYILKLPPFV
jgi:pyruvate/2-oxoglutarate dehydrogenase complex dihydrolipoamide dehydrogenase (E3) component